MCFEIERFIFDTHANLHTQKKNKSDFNENQINEKLFKRKLVLLFFIFKNSCFDSLIFNFLQLPSIFSCHSVHYIKRHQFYFILFFFIKQRAKKKKMNRHFLLIDNTLKCFCFCDLSN